MTMWNNAGKTGITDQWAPSKQTNSKLFYNLKTSTRLGQQSALFLTNMYLSDKIWWFETGYNVIMSKHWKFIATQRQEVNFLWNKLQLVETNLEDFQIIFVPWKYA